MYPRRRGRPRRAPSSWLYGRYCADEDSIGIHSPLIHSKPSGQSCELGAEASGSPLAAEVPAGSVLDDAASPGIELTSEAGALEAGSSLAGTLDAGCPLAEVLDAGASLEGAIEDIDETSADAAPEDAEFASAGADDALGSSERASELGPSDGGAEGSELVVLVSPPCPRSCTA